jgi:hypothetical protein
MHSTARPVYQVAVHPSGAVCTLYSYALYSAHCTLHPTPCACTLHPVYHVPCALYSALYVSDVGHLSPSPSGWGAVGSRIPVECRQQHILAVMLNSHSRVSPARLPCMRTIVHALYAPCTPPDVSWHMRGAGLYERLVLYISRGPSHSIKDAGSD